MKKNLKKVLVVLFALALVITSVKTTSYLINDFEKSKTSNDNIKTLSIGKQKKPRVKKEEVEVFSPNGKMRHVYIDSDKIDANTKKYSATKSTSKDWHMSQEEKERLCANDLGFKAVDIVKNGDDSSNYCILIAGDGFTQSEQDKFLQTARSIADYFLTREPFSYPEVKNKINIRAVCVTSEQSGVSLDPNNPYKTFFKTTFNNNNIERLICIHDYDNLKRVIAQYMPECSVPFVVGNSDKYGGSGGSVCTISNHYEAKDIAFHEFGHTGGGLADEYWETTTSDSNGYEAPNRTAESDPNRCKWAKYIGKNGVGLYAFEENNKWYRPHQNCEMRYLNKEFCDVCKNHIKERIVGTVNSKIKDYEVINSAEELRNYVLRVNESGFTQDKTVVLNSDINVPSANYIPQMNSFKGTFDGNGHTINGLNITSSSNEIAFIRNLESSGVVKNLYLKNITISGTGYYCAGIAANNRGLITQCGVEGNITGDNAAGGIVGNLTDNGNVNNCYSNATVTTRNQVSGGIVGWLGNGTVDNCFGYGKAVSNDGYWYGGVVGYKPGGNITNCHFNNANTNKGIGSGNSGVTSRSANEFSNGTVCNALNSVSNVWQNSNPYPVFRFTSTQVTTKQVVTTKPETYYSHIYQDINYGGNTIGLPLGRFTTSDLVSRGFKNDDLSSIKVSQGYRAILYDGDNFSGNMKIVSGDVSWIGGDFNDIVSSIIVEKEPVTTAKPTTTAVQTTTATPTTKPTTKAYKSGLIINGYQISATNLGVRTIYSVSGKINNKNVVESGVVYALEDKVGNTELNINSNNKYIKSFASTNKGLANKTYSDFDDVKSYAMTIKYTSENKNEFTDSWKIRAYAKLSDGSVTYSNTVSFNGFDLAKNLYEGRKMKNGDAHNLLYDRILKIVDNNYKRINY